VRYRRLSRRHFLALCGGALVAGLPSRAQVQPATIRLGFVLPRQSGQLSSRFHTQELAGEAAYKGAVMGEEDFGAGSSLELLVSSAPDGTAARRAGARLAASEGVLALVGGFGDDQALALSRVAEDHGVLFFNIGSSSTALRGACHRFTFHVEASAAMYLGALTSWFAGAGFRRWFFVYPESGEGRALYKGTQRALQRQRGGATEVGRVGVSATPVYGEAVEAIQQAEPELVLLLLDWRSQLDFLGYYEAAGLEFAVTGFPDPVTQTRDFLIASKEVARQDTPPYRVALWEATLEPHGAHTLNERFFGRWGVPMDPSAWAAYQSVGIISEAAAEPKTLNSAELAAYLESPRARFDVQKGSGVSFSPRDHQLHQPLYIVRGNPAAEKSRNMARLVARVPAPDVNPARFSSDVRSDPRCRR
jgi:ABC-type branched-subunit amino acid transport system substrate-binding protein